MDQRIRVKPGKATALVGMIVGVLFVVLGVVVIIPIFGPFGMVWTAIAGAIAVYCAYNFFSAGGAAMYEVELGSQEPAEDFEAKLRKLAKLKEDGLISSEEFEQKRAEIMRPKW